MMNNEDFVTFSQATKLKELGFDWECDYCYYYNFHNHDNPIFARHEQIDPCDVEEYWDAPTLSQAQKWLREKGLVININYDPIYYYGDIFNKAKHGWQYFITEGFLTYESVLSVMIDSALELLNKK